MYLGENRRWVPLYHCSFSEGDLVEQTKIALSAIKIFRLGPSGPFFLYCQIISRVTMTYSVMKSVFRGPSDFKLKKQRFSQGRLVYPPPPGGGRYCHMWAI